MLGLQPPSPQKLPGDVGAFGGIRLRFGLWALKRGFCAVPLSTQVGNVRWGEAGGNTRLSSPGKGWSVRGRRCLMGEARAEGAGPQEGGCGCCGCPGQRLWTGSGRLPTAGPALWAWGRLQSFSAPVLPRATACFQSQHLLLPRSLSGGCRSGGTAGPGWQQKCPANAIACGKVQHTGPVLFSRDKELYLLTNPPAPDLSPCPKSTSRSPAQTPAPQMWLEVGGEEDFRQKPGAERRTGAAVPACRGSGCCVAVVYRK